MGVEEVVDRKHRMGRTEWMVGVGVEADCRGCRGSLESLGCLARWEGWGVADAARPWGRACCFWLGVGSLTKGWWWHAGWAG